MVMHTATADLNALYFRHQIALIRADQSLALDTRDVYRANANALAGQIGQIQRVTGATANVAWSTITAKDPGAAQ